MITLLVLACVTVYYGLGIRFVTQPFITAHAAKHIRDFPSLAEQPGSIDEERRFAAVFGLLLAIIWPVVAIGRPLIRSLAASAPLSDTEARLQLQQRDQRIAELERELGIRR